MIRSDASRNDVFFCDSRISKVLAKDGSLGIFLMITLDYFRFSVIDFSLRSLGMDTIDQPLIQDFSSLSLDNI